MFRSSNAAKSVRQVRPLCCSMSFDARELQPSCKRLAFGGSRPQERVRYNIPVSLHNGPDNTPSGEPMLTATRILTNTPLWVFALLAYLIWQGSQSLRPRTQPIWRMLIVPLVFFLMGLSRLVTARDRGLEPLLAWVVAAVLFGSLAVFLWPKLLAVGR